MSFTILRETRPDADNRHLIINTFLLILSSSAAMVQAVEDYVPSIDEIDITREFEQEKRYFR